MSATVDVTGGERVLQWATITEAAGQPLDVDSVLLSVTPLGGAHTWRAPDLSAAVDTATVRAALLVDARFPPGTYRLWARISDTPETEFVPVDGSRITVR